MARFRGGAALYPAHCRWRGGEKEETSLVCVLRVCTELVAVSVRYVPKVCLSVSSAEAVGFGPQSLLSHPEPELEDCFRVSWEEQGGVTPAQTPTGSTAPSALCGCIVHSEDPTRSMCCSVADLREKQHILLNCLMYFHLYKLQVICFEACSSLKQLNPILLQTHKPTSGVSDTLEDCGKFNVCSLG